MRALPPLRRSPVLATAAVALRTLRTLPISPAPLSASLHLSMHRHPTPTAVLHRVIGSVHCCCAGLRPCPKPTSVLLGTAAAPAAVPGSDASQTANNGYIALQLVMGRHDPPVLRRAHPDSILFFRQHSHWVWLSTLHLAACLTQA